MLKKILSISSIVALLFTGIAYASTISQVPSSFETSLSFSIQSTDTQLNLVSGTLRDGTILQGYVCLTVDSGTTNLEYMCGTASSTSVGLVTGLQRGLDAVTGTTSISSLEYAHRRGADVKITDYPTLTLVQRELSGLDTLASKLTYGATSTISISSDGDIPDLSYLKSNYFASTTNGTWNGNNNFTGSNTFSGSVLFTNPSVTFNSPPTLVSQPTLSTQVANKAYVDSVSVAGAPNAGTTTKGIVQEATFTDINSGNATGSTGARLYINPNSFVVGGGVTTNGVFGSFIQNVFNTSIIATTTSLIPSPELFGAPSNAGTFASTTSAKVTLVSFPIGITINKVTFNVNTVNTAGKIKVGLYDHLGNKIFEATSTQISSGTTTTIIIPSVAINAGSYYVAETEYGLGSFNLVGYLSDSTLVGTLNTATGAASPAVYSGSIQIASGTLPTSFVPSSITQNGVDPNNNVLLRLDN